MSAELNRAVQRYETENRGTTVLAIDIEPALDETEDIRNARVQHWAEKLGELCDQWQLTPESRGGKLFREIAEILKSNGTLDDLNSIAELDTNS